MISELSWPGTGADRVLKLGLDIDSRGIPFIHEEQPRNVMQVIPSMTKLLTTLSGVPPHLDFTSMWIVAHEDVALPKTDQGRQHAIMIGKDHKVSLVIPKGTVNQDAQRITYEGPQGALRSDLASST